MAVELIGKGPNRRNSRNVFVLAFISRLLFVRQKHHNTELTLEKTLHIMNTVFAELCVLFWAWDKTSVESKHLCQSCLSGRGCVLLFGCCCRLLFLSFGILILSSPLPHDSLSRAQAEP